MKITKYYTVKKNNKKKIKKEKRKNKAINKDMVTVEGKDVTEGKEGCVL